MRVAVGFVLHCTLTGDRRIVANFSGGELAEGRR
jgi:hypothetical protein